MQSGPVTCTVCRVNGLFGFYHMSILLIEWRHHTNTMQGGPLVGIIMGSSSDARIMRGAAQSLDELGIPHEDSIISAHRTPSRLSEYARHAEESRFRVIIAGAGGAAHLPGMVSSYTTIPVVGVPILVYADKGPAGRSSAFGGLDALLSMSEMPSGSPVGVMGINKAASAGIYAAMILANEFPSIRNLLGEYKRSRFETVVRESEELTKMGLGGMND